MVKSKSSLYGIKLTDQISCLNCVISMSKKSNFTGKALHLCSISCSIGLLQHNANYPLTLQSTAEASYNKVGSETLQ